MNIEPHDGEHGPIRDFLRRQAAFDRADNAMKNVFLAGMLVFALMILGELT